jgi:tetratricopeptide (TPR) repeat protein
MLAMLVTGGAAVAGNPAAREAAADMEWGYKTARRGYWQEALARFEHANELTPDQPRILNNIAVAQEANGLYEQALLTYQEGLTIAPNNDALRRNYMRFQEFYSSYIAPPEESEDLGAGGEGADDAQDNS